MKARRKIAGGLGVILPIGGRGSQAPEIARGFPADAHKPVFASICRRQVAGYLGDYAFAARQIVNSEPHPRLQGTRKTDAAAKRIHQQCVAVFRKGGCWIETRYPQWNLRANASSFPALDECRHDR